jgi:tRNA (adenine22-N1)-methyltransferase
MEIEVVRLSPRLAAVANAIAPGSRVADVGTDHGRLPLWLAASGRAAYCLATERNEALLARVSRPPADAAWADRLAYRAGDGLHAIRPEDRIDTIVLAGLGGRTIVRLLGAAAAETDPPPGRLVLQPRSEAALARGWLSEHGWRPVSEQLAFDRGRFHATIAAERGDDADLYRDPDLTREDLLVAGPLLARSTALEVTEFWRLERARLASILARPGSEPSWARLRAGIGRASRILAAISTRAG